LSYERILLGSSVVTLTDARFDFKAIGPLAPFGMRLSQEF